MFHQSLPLHDHTSHLQLVRVKAGQTVSGLICGPPVRTYAHYYKNQSLPCIEGMTDVCPLCDVGYKRRYYAYYPSRNQHGKTAFIELTMIAETELLNCHRPESESSIPQITVKRKAGRRNNPLTLSVKWHELTPEQAKNWETQLTDPSEIQKTLLILWDLPKQRTGETDPEYGDRIAEILMARVL